MDIRRKPPSKVRNISGRDFNLDEVTDADYERVVDLQAATLKAQKAERQELLALRERLREGALDQGKRYFFDHELGIVRRRERQKAGGE